MSQLTPEKMEALWDAHVEAEFASRSIEKTMATMTTDPYVNHVPTLTGGAGVKGLREFYERHFISKLPPDTESVPVSRTVGKDRIVEEMIFKFTHTIVMDFMLPGVPPTGKRVEVPLVAIIEFRDGKVATERIYWDQASILQQIGLLDGKTLPIAGIESAKKVLDPSLPSNKLIERGAKGRR